MRVILANGLGEDALRACRAALEAAAGDVALDVHVIAEQGTREATWNLGLERAGSDRDVLFLGDDVRLTPGALAALERGARSAEIVGLCTLEPGSDRVQDRGYDLVRVDGRVTVEARDRGRRRGDLPAFGVAPCDAVCGCLFYAKASVLGALERFRPEGMNRWGELIFALEARQRGARIAVVEHYVEHAGEGTKHNADPLLSSTSWTTERQLWSRLVDRYVAPSWVRRERVTELAPALVRWLAQERPLVVYGAGTIAELLLRRPELAARPLTLCSGLEEEAGLIFQGQRIRRLDAVSFGPDDGILLTPLHRGERIAAALGPRLPDPFHGEIVAVARDRATGRLELEPIALPSAAA